MKANILIVSIEYPPGPGGIGTHAFQVSKELHKAGWRVSVVTHQDYVPDEEIETFNRQQPFQIFRQRHESNSLVEGFNRFRQLNRAIKEVQPDILLATGTRAVWLAALAARRHGLPWTAVAHGGVEFGTTRLWEQKITRWAYSQPDAAICVSQYTRQMMLDHGVQVPKIEVITNGADHRAFYLEADAGEAFRQQCNLETSKILLTVGNVTERKGQQVVIQALPHILAEKPDVHYLMIGLPTIQAQLEPLARKIGVEKNIHFLGRVDATTLRAAYNACDLFLMTSRHSQDGDSEGYGIAVIEAALCGKAAVVSGESGLAEAVLDGETGLLVPEDDPDATAQAALRLLNDEGLRSRMGLQARQRANKEQTWETQGQRFTNFLSTLLS